MPRESRKNDAGTTPIPVRRAPRRRCSPATSATAAWPMRSTCGPSRAYGLAWRPGVLRPAPSYRRQPSCSPASPRQPSRRHPARLPRAPGSLRRDDRLGAPPSPSAGRRVNSTPPVPLRNRTGASGTCGAPGCTNTVRRQGTGRPASFCSTACRAREFRSRKPATTAPVTVEVDMGSATSRGRPPERAWLVRIAATTAT